MYLLAEIIGACIPVGLMFMFLMFLFKQVPLVWPRVAVVSAVTFVAHVTLMAVGDANGGPLAWGRSIPLALVVQVIVAPIVGLYLIYWNRRRRLSKLNDSKLAS